MKRINKRIFCTLTLISSTFLPYLTINVKTTTNIPRAKIWTEDSGNINNGQNGFMFEDNRGNLWSAGYGAALQRYNYGTHTWETSDDIAGNLSDGDGGFMFQDSRRNLWSAGYGTPLQKYDYGTNTWESNAKISGNLSSGQEGFMFEDSRRNLWSAGFGTPLQKYDYDTRTWDSSSKTSGNLSSGQEGFMFEDSRRNLWSAGFGTPLQKYDYDTRTWDSSSKTSGNLKDGNGGFMFEDSRRNLWSAGFGTPLQKSDNGSNIWKTGIKIMRIRSNNFGGFMFEDSKNNLWSSGLATPLQKYNYITSTWETSAPIRQNLKDDLKDGWSSFMFQDSKGNLWSVGNNTPLQKYDYDNKVWKTNDAIKGNISNGQGGFIFEDSKGHLWSAGKGTVLQVMYSDKDIASVIALIQANTGMTKNATGEILPILTSSNTPFDAAALSSLGAGGTFPTNIRDTTLTYSHGGITSDGDLVVTVKIAKGIATASATFTVDVAGIDEAKKDRIQKTNLQALKMQLTSGAVTKITNKVETIAARIIGAASLKEETGIDLTGLVLTSTYEISAVANGASGAITISVIMTTDGAATTISDAVAHTINHKSDTEVQNNLDKADVDIIKGKIDIIAGVKKTTTSDMLQKNDETFDAAALSSLGTSGIFPDDTKGTTLTYAHEGITSDGDLTVAVKIAKGRATAFASFIVVVRGIDLAKTKVQKEANKFGDFGSTDSLNSAAAILSQNKEDVKTQFEAITGYKVPSLTDGYSISKVIVKTALDPKTKKVVYTVTISDTNSNIATKDIVVTFAVKAISKDKDLSKGAIAGITIGSILGIGILGFLIYYYFKKTKIKH